jgi:hypothetical protein
MCFNSGVFCFGGFGEDCFEVRSRYVALAYLKPLTLYLGLPSAGTVYHYTWLIVYLMNERHSVRKIRYNLSIINKWFNIPGI